MPPVMCNPRPRRHQVLAIAAISVLCSTATGAGAQTAELVFVVEEVRNSDGFVRVALCPEEQFLTEECLYNASAEAVEGETTVTFEDVPPGIYGVQGFHDENANEEMDRNLVGWPLEGFSFANDPQVLFRAPSFESSAITIAEDAESVEARMKMRYR